MIRTPQALVPYAFALAFLAAGALWHLAGETNAARVRVTGVASVGGSFALLDQNGETRTDADFRGRWMLIYFGYTHCPDVCPTTLSLMSEVLNRLGKRAQRLAPIFITVDPERDTPEVMKAYLASFDPRFIGLTGPPSHIASAAAAYRVYVGRHLLPGGGYSMDHSGVIYLMSPAGNFAADYDESEGPDVISQDLEKRL